MVGSWPTIISGQKENKKREETNEIKINLNNLEFCWVRGLYYVNMKNMNIELKLKLSICTFRHVVIRIMWMYEGLCVLYGYLSFSLVPYLRFLELFVITLREFYF